MILNEQLSWPAVHPENAAENAKVNQAFLNGKAEKVLLPGGMGLYKFNTAGRSLIFKGGVSPWWFPIERFGDFGNGLKDVLDFAKVNGVSSTEYQRLIAAVTEEWNEMNVIMKIELKTNVYGFWGQCTMQSKRTGSKVNLTGRAYQLYIPGLTGDHVMEVSISSAPPA